MDPSTGKYLCDSCNLKFKDFKQHLSHQYQQHDEDELRPVIHKEDETSQNSSNNFKTSCKMGIGKTIFIERHKNNSWTDSARDVFHYHKTTQLQHVSLTERPTMLPSSRKVTGHGQMPSRSYHLNSEHSANEQFLSLKYSQKKICRFERKSQVNTSQQSISSECNQMHIYTHGPNEQFNRNLSSATQYNRIQHFGHGNNQQVGANKSPASSGIKQMIDTNSQVNKNNFALSVKYSPMLFSTCEITQQFSTNLQSVSPEYSEIEFSKHGMNLQFSASKRAATDAHDYNSMTKRVSSSLEQHRVNKIELNLLQYSKKSFGRSTNIHKDSNPTCKLHLYQKEMNISPINLSGFQAHNKTSASDSSLKNSYVLFEETSEKCESSERVNPTAEKTYSEISYITKIYFLMKKYYTYSSGLPGEEKERMLLSKKGIAIIEANCICTDNLPELCLSNHDPGESFENEE
ncbi:hypothetical protein TNIN_462991 [Trichonephila inaurata madagascariensis]|uniref:C2H2-type domain-containing protein n=1 Tax=Trichonephila inaurata madagascariensis TaxID=2747483 RepID=A0A8X6Y330_9ARAC|nr:hypothetical protein TNIN_462991 [Trichonephila inaurata madagascariensis]